MKQIKKTQHKDILATHNITPEIMDRFLDTKRKLTSKAKEEIMVAILSEDELGLNKLFYTHYKPRDFDISRGFSHISKDYSHPPFPTAESAELALDIVKHAQKENTWDGFEIEVSQQFNQETLRQFVHDKYLVLGEEKYTVTPKFVGLLKDFLDTAVRKEELEEKASANTKE